MTEETADAGGCLVAPIFIAPLIGAIGRCVYMLQQELKKENERKSFFSFFFFVGVGGLGNGVPSTNESERGGCL